MKFNEQKCLELIAESNKLLQQGKSLWDYDKVKNKKWVEYITMLHDDIYWKTRDQYLQIIEGFISKIITVDEFIKKFDDLRRSNMNVSEMWEKNLATERDLPNPKSRGFTKIISNIDMRIEIFDPEVTLDINLKYPELVCYGMSEEFFKLDLKNNYLPRISEYCKKSKISYNISLLTKMISYLVFLVKRLPFSNTKPLLSLLLDPIRLSN